MVLLATSASLLLSSCLVEKDKIVEKIARKTDTLRIYRDGDFIDYNLTAIISANGDIPVTQIGSVRILWESIAELQDPITLANIVSTYPVLKETTTLTYEGNDIPDATVVRYISQVNTDSADPDQGSMLLHAIEAAGEKFWPYDPTTTSNSSSPVIRPVIFASPLISMPSSPYAYSIMECNSPGLCDTKIYTLNENIFAVVGDTREISTNLGIFSNPFQINFSGTTTPNGEQAIAFLGDIRDACGTSSDQISHNGEMFVIPEIGVIRMEHDCTISPSGNSVHYILTVRNTSFN
ncbi:MAG: hypothetical protein RRB22_01765 [Gammaproteobacteria bacterium]|nr:hypothetical protein [Gammaproteobacteria bacterium]